jgi:2-polyprenyl-3-methyl-5-hydroxy-6-metoxy-1,4-benzoquinol methylase
MARLPEFTKDWDSEPLALLPGDLRGQRVLDLACGYGTFSRYLARRQANVTGIDISVGLLARARQLEADQPLGIRYLQGDVTSTDWWDSVPYDGVLCNMALMDNCRSRASRAEMSGRANGYWCIRERPD